MTVRTVVLDIGGVLLDWDPRYLYDELIPDPAQRDHFLANVATLDWNRLQDGGRSWAEAVADLTGRFPDHAEWIEAYDKDWLRMVRGVFPETEAVVGELRAAGVPLYALTNFSAEKWETALDTFGVLRAFDGAVVSGVEQVMKPDEQIYRILLERYRLDPARTFFTDDVARNVEGARAVGIQAEQFTDAARLRAALVRHSVLSGAA